MTTHERWSPRARRLGITSAAGILGVGILYVATIIAWLILEATPREPIGDPYLAVMDVLTILSGLAVLGFVIATSCFADTERRVQALAALILGSIGGVLTMAVHFVQLTAVRQLWRAGHLGDYRLLWPSPLFAVEYFVWDVLIGLTMVFAGAALAGAPNAVPARRAMVLAGALCLLGVAGPLSGRMLIQNLALLGYGVGLPVAAALTVRVFRDVPPFTVAA